MSFLLLQTWLVTSDRAGYRPAAVRIGVDPRCAFARLDKLNRCLGAEGVT